MLHICVLCPELADQCLHSRTIAILECLPYQALQEDLELIKRSNSVDPRCSGKKLVIKAPSEIPYHSCSIYPKTGSVSP